MYHDLLVEQHLFAANTFVDCGDTFHGTRRSSRIDYISLPIGARDRVKEVRICYKEGRALQVVPDKFLRDHMPLMVVFVGSELYPKHDPEQQRWSHDKVATALSIPSLRKNFVEEVEEALIVEDLTGKCLEQLPDTAWDTLSEVVLRVGKAHFGEDRSVRSPEESRWQCERRELIKKRASLRLQLGKKAEAESLQGPLTPSALSLTGMFSSGTKFVPLLLNCWLLDCAGIKSGSGTVTNTCMYLL